MGDSEPAGVSSGAQPDAQTHGRPGGRPAADRGPRRGLRRWLLIGALAAVVASLVVRALVLQTFYIPSGSMHPTLLEDDKIVVEKWSYWGSGAPEHGDVVVFADPAGWLREPEVEQTPNEGSSAFTRLLERAGVLPTGGHLVKRVIGLPGDVVACCDARGRLRVNGVPLDEDYLENDTPCNGPMPNACRTDWTAGPVPDGTMFVMGDHRDSSSDSSAHLCAPDETECGPARGMVPLSLIVGKVWAVAWPRDRMQFLHRPAAFE